MKTPKDFVPGDSVVYLPTLEDGLVTSTGEVYVFVKFDPTKRYGLACYPRDLEKQTEHL